MEHHAHAPPLPPCSINVLSSRQAGAEKTRYRMQELVLALFMLLVPHALAASARGLLQATPNSLDNGATPVFPFCR